MKIKRFVAPDMRQALRMVRETLGEDAVILSNKSIDEGVELTAAVDLVTDETEEAAAPKPAPGAAARQPEARARRQRKPSVAPRVETVADDEGSPPATCRPCARRCTTSAAGCRPNSAA